MLVLERKLHQSIMLGDDITITVIEIDRGKIRLGIEAPLCVSVDRLEVRQRKLDAERNEHNREIQP